MRESISLSKIETTKIDGPFRPEVDKIVRRKFAAVAKVLWGKPDAAIAAIARVDPRTGRRILRGEVDVPSSVMLAALHEMLRPLE